MADALHSLGFTSHLGNKLFRHICFRKPEFAIKERMTIGSDIVNFYFGFQRKSEKNEYACIYYDATLRKEINITGSVINDINRKVRKSKCRKLIGILITKTKLIKNFRVVKRLLVERRKRLIKW